MPRPTFESVESMAQPVGGQRISPETRRLDAGNSSSDSFPAHLPAIIMAPSPPRLSFSAHHAPLETETLPMGEKSNGKLGEVLSKQERELAQDWIAEQLKASR